MKRLIKLQWFDMILLNKYPQTLYDSIQIFYFWRNCIIFRLHKTTFSFHQHSSPHLASLIWTSLVSHVLSKNMLISIPHIIPQGSLQWGLQRFSKIPKFYHLLDLKLAIVMTRSSISPSCNCDSYGLLWTSSVLQILSKNFCCDSLGLTLCFRLIPTPLIMS